VQVRLAAGSHTLFLSFEPANENMPGGVNDALLDYMRLTRVKDDTGQTGN
jgi:hypothetical protein